MKTITVLHLETEEGEKKHLAFEIASIPEEIDEETMRQLEHQARSILDAQLRKIRGKYVKKKVTNADLH